MSDATQQTGLPAEDAPEALKADISTLYQITCDQANEITELRKVLEASRCIKHWHCSGDSGMIVSREHVFALWEAIEAHDKAMGLEDV